MEQQSTLKGKLDVRARLRLETGLHIGASSDFAPIGAVDRRSGRSFPAARSRGSCAHCLCAV